jgi:NAD(P)-dependent dehydrogenase (short-subunit alcohol dehydrogenase family)
MTMNIEGKSAIITGAGSGIGQAAAVELAQRGIGAVGLVDRSENVINVARAINDRMDQPVAEAMIGDVTDAAFRQKMYDLMCTKYGPPAVCFRLVVEVNLICNSAVSGELWADAGWHPSA